MKIIVNEGVPPRLSQFYDFNTRQYDIIGYILSKRRWKSQYGGKLYWKLLNNGDQNNSHCFRPRQTYERRDPKTSQWWIDYVLDVNNTWKDETHRNGKIFRRRFRVPFNFIHQIFTMV